LRSKLLYYSSSMEPSQTKITKYTIPLPTYELHESWGHSLATIDSSTTFRVFLQNPNGLSLSTTNYSLLQDFQTCQEYGAAAICLPETNTNWDLVDQQAILHNILRQTWRNASAQTSKAPETFLSQYQPGGTATIVCNNWVSRIIQKGEDPIGLGHWTYITLRGKGSKKVTVITAYNASPSQGDTTFFQQQHRLLSQLHRQHNQQAAPHPRRQFILDLQAWIEELQSQDHDIILL
jgi:hypothetical protein